MGNVKILNAILSDRLCDLYIKEGVIYKIVYNTADQESVALKEILDIEFSSIDHKVIDANKKYVIPSFVNMHTHAAMTLMRGVGEDMSLMDWLYKKIWPIEQRLDQELIYWGTKLACLEMLKTGTTVFNDQYWHINKAVEAASEMGLCSFHSFVILDLNDASKKDKIIDDCNIMFEQSKNWPTSQKFTIGIHAPYSVSKEMIEWGADFARKNNLLLHIHVSETEFENNESIKKHGVTPTQYLDSLGVLDRNVIAAHSLWMSDKDIEIFAKRGVNVVHNINSNLKIASGYKFRYNEFRDAGVNVTLGTDGCASSNNLDMLETMKTTALVQKAWRYSPTALPIDELMNLSTFNGYKALGINAGVVQEGAQAHLLLIDTDSYAFTPNINFLANLIYSANSSCVDTVISNGNVVMQNREVIGQREILDNVNRLYKKLID